MGWISRDRIPAAAGDPVAALGVFVVALAAVSFAPQLLNDGDTFWHIRAGEWMLDHRAILRSDPFSYTFAGKPWQTHEWLAEILFAGAYRTGGFSGVMLLTAAAFAATGGLVAWHLSRFLSRRATLLASLLALAAVAGSLLARPHLLALPLLALWTAELAIARSTKRAPLAWLLSVMILWANLHASFIVGIALAAAFAFDAALEEHDRWNAVAPWLLFVLGSLIAAIFTPFGIAGLLFPLTLNAMPSLAFVGEWQPTDLLKLYPFEIGLAMALYIAVTRRVRPGIARAAILVGLVWLAFAHARHQMLLGIVAPLVLAEPFGAKLGDGQASQLRYAQPMLAAVCAAVLAIAIARLAIPVTRGDAKTAPVTALAHVPPALARQPVLNAYGFGGYLVFAGVRPYIDGRAELYGNAWLARYAELLRGPRSTLEAALDRSDVAWTIVEPDSPLEAKLDSLAGWKRLYTDRWAVVHVRTDGRRQAIQKQPLKRNQRKSKTSLS